MWIEDDKFVGMSKIQHQPRALIEHVGIKALGMQKPDLVFQVSTFGGHVFCRGLHLHHLLMQLRPSNEPAIAMEYVENKIKCG